MAVVMLSKQNQSYLI